MNNKIDEIIKYNKSQVNNKGEINEWDEFIFPLIIRRKLVRLIKDEVEKRNPNLILDYGCGGGWISVLLSDIGYPTIGMDISVQQLNKAKIACKNGNFFACDAEFLPIRSEAVEFTIGISILYHLKVSKCLDEIERVSKKNSYFLFEEPNVLNPFSAFGRKLFPMDTHTIGEKPFFYPYFIQYFKHKTIFSVHFFYFLAFPLSRFLKLFKIKLSRRFIIFYYYLETLSERIFPFNKINASIILVGQFLK